VLVTGAAGLIGAVVADALRFGGHQTFTTSRRSLDTVGHHVADLTSPADAAAVLNAVEPGAIIHLAGGVSGGRHDLYRANVLTTVRLLEAVARLAPEAHTVVVGSAAEYGDGDRDDIDEDTSLRPVSDYGRAKVAATSLAETLAGDHDLSLTIARPFNIVSRRLPVSTALGNLRAQLLQQSGRQRIVRCGRLDVVRDFVPVDFVAEALHRLATDRISGTYNICSGVGIPLGSVLDAMAAMLDTEVQIEFEPELVALPAADRAVGSPAKLAALGLTTQPTAASLARLCVT
jgi:nucleoside-diphosphate-sugar epimerase